MSDQAAALGPPLQDTTAPALDLLDALPDEHPFRSADPLQHRRQTYEVVTRLLLDECRLRPVAVVVEDLHWIDSLSNALLKHLAARAADARLLLVVSYRPDYRDEWEAAPNHRRLYLEPLAGGSAAGLLEALLGTDPGLRSLSRLLLERTGGNPFFLEEIVRALADTGALEGERGRYRLAKPFSSIEVPPTVHSVLGARIDALPAPAKRLLQEAAVIGRDVPLPLLHAVSGWAQDDLRGLLGSLEDAEIIYTTRRFPEVQYTFKHALTHDVAYAGLLHERRREIHARVVGAVEELYADRTGEQLERLAGHALRGHLWDKAVGYLRQAGVKAADRQAHQEAVVLLDQALGALAHLPENRRTLEQAIDVRFELRNALQPLGERGRIADCLREAEELANRIQDARRLGWAQSYLTDHFWILGRYTETAEAGGRALRIAEQLSDLPLRVVTNLPLGLAHHTSGDYRRAMVYFGWNVVRLGPEHVRERFGMFVLPSTFSRSFMAWALAELGEFAEGSAIGEEALGIAEAAEHPFSCGYAHLGLGVLALRRGDVRGALRSFERSLGAGAFADSPVGFAYVAFHLGYARALIGQPIGGISTLEQTVDVAEARGFVARHALRLAYLSEAYLIEGRLSDAAKTGSRALRLAREHDERANEAYALRALGEVDVHYGKLAEAEAGFRAALMLSEDLGMRPLAAHCHLGLADVFEASRRLPEAAAHRALGMASIEALRMRPWRDAIPRVADGGSRPTRRNPQRPLDMGNA